MSASRCRRRNWAFCSVQVERKSGPGVLRLVKALTAVSLSLSPLPSSLGKLPNSNPYRLTCVFLATKTENCSTSIDQFAARIPNSEPADILALEFLVSQSLHFEYKVHHAYVALNGLVLDMQVRVHHCSFPSVADLASSLRAMVPSPQKGST